MNFISHSISKYYLLPWLLNLAFVFFYITSPSWIGLLGSLTNYEGVVSDPFDGTTIPIEFVPDYAQHTQYAKNRIQYVDIPSEHIIAVPEYDANILKRDLYAYNNPTEEYWETLRKRLIYITPYMWAYTHTGKEHIGSHLAVDIKAAPGTPVKAIANGVVFRAENQVNGFGQFVSLRHDDVEINGEVTDIYSGYAHLQKIYVEPGEKVSKGQTIGEIGSTGISTTPHLHFQIDTADAPFKMYWPFVHSQAARDGYNFFEAVNAWYGKENALKYTIHPMDFVYDNLHLSSVTEEENNFELASAWEEETQIDNTEEPIKQEEIEEKEFLDEIEEPKDEMQEPLTEKEEIVAEEREIVQKPEIKKSVLNLEEADVVNITSAEIMTTDINFSNDFMSDFSSLEDLEELSIVEEEREVAILGDSETKQLLEGIINDVTEVETMSVQTFAAEEEENETLPFSDVDNNHPFYTAILELKKDGKLDGYQDGTFKPDNLISRGEVSKMILKGFNLAISEDKNNYFRDVSHDSWQKKYINALVEREIISLNNPEFNINGNITRIEGLKMILKINDIDLEKYKNIEINMTDVEPGTWFYPYVAYAIEYELLNYQDTAFSPNKPLNRGEIVSLIYKMTQ